tara:strand:+ start:4301 stop:5371 length:1071 start_codon:yes stop_codon:yes gene_type:complete
MKTSQDVQRSALRRMLFASGGIFLYSALVIICYNLGYILIDSPQFVVLMVTFWCGHAAALLFLFLRYRKHLLVPDITLLHMVWATLYISIIMYHTVEIRPVLMMSYLTIVSFGVFRLQWRGLFGITLFTFSCYAITLFLLQQHRPGHWVPEVEIIVGAAFLLAMFGYSAIGHEFSLIRDRYSDNKQQLQIALDKIEELSTTDSLTGLHNRRHLMKVLDQQKAISNRENTSFILACIDLDDFKKIIDRYGYEVGNEVLCKFSELLKDSIREVDVVARTGGEEFILLLNGIGIETASIVVERIRYAVEVLLFSKLELSVTISVGITEYQAPESIADILERAGKLLHDAKREGCNRIKQ